MGALLAIVNLIAGIAGALMPFAAGRAHAADAQPVEIVAFGDSLTAGYMLNPADSFPAQLEKALRAKGRAVTVTNAGVSGDTTGAGLARFAWAVPDTADAVILELGANDALRGIAPGIARENLEQILAQIGQRGLPVLIAGMKAPRNWGDDYARDFDAIFPHLAEKHGALLYPFFLDGVALDPTKNLGDGLHPNAAGVAAIVDRILPDVEKLIARAEERRKTRPPNRS
jgi:acyl-CoA thioesterase-1